MKKILLIEDQRPMRESLALTLEMEGFCVISAEGGRLGLELARMEIPDLVLCDIMMPDVDGHAVLGELRRDARTAAIPFIFLTAKGEKPDLRAGMNLGADDYLVKPVPKTELLDAIRARLERQIQHEAQTQVRVSQAKFRTDFSTSRPLEALGISPREAEVLLWIAQGKNNEEIGIILSASRNTIKKHVVRVLEKLGVESRQAAALRAIELLSRTVTAESGVQSPNPNEPGSA
jgi:DNA-binding NarL/FixJ family response regulator